VTEISFATPKPEGKRDIRAQLDDVRLMLFLFNSPRILNEETGSPSSPATPNVTATEIAEDINRAILKLYANFISEVRFFFSSANDFPVA
jgi:hypothetical protein